MGKNRLEAFSDGVLTIPFSHAVRRSGKRGGRVIPRTVARPPACVHVLLADALFVLVAILRIIPDRRLEQAPGHS
jgi:hypothetical protein